jgi:hypothetical protein
MSCETTNFDHQPGCCNHGCPLRPPVAVGTNGGCKCLRELTPINRLAVYGMRELINRLEEKNRKLEEQIEKFTSSAT